mmetsp:Transcript_46455/g.115213  ORF Transcript_46455/g.115213 Transcript_46455/m.115213 type:complete len:217 (+) Transcript_46455:310-960(+)
MRLVHPERDDRGARDGATHAAPRARAWRELQPRREPRVPPMRIAHKENDLHAAASNRGADHEIVGEQLGGRVLQRTPIASHRRKHDVAVRLPLATHVLQRTPIGLDGGELKLTYRALVARLVGIGSAAHPDHILRQQAQDRAGGGDGGKPDVEICVSGVLHRLAVVRDGSKHDDLIPPSSFASILKRQSVLTHGGQHDFAIMRCQPRQEPQDGAVS